jgi:hypothetical protein
MLRTALELLFGLACGICEQTSDDLWEVGDKSRRLLICRSCHLDHKIRNGGEHILVTKARTGIPVHVLLKRRVLH